VSHLNYKILEIFEAVIYFESTDLFSNYLKFFASKRLQNQGFPSGVETGAQKQAYCDEVNDLMGFEHEKMKLVPDKIVLNKPTQQVQKLLQNGIIGKLSQGSHKSSIIYISSGEELSAVNERGDITIDDWFLIAPTVLQLRVKKRHSFVPPNNSVNMVVSAFTTSQSRIKMDFDLRKIEANGCRLAYTDTDSMVTLVNSENPAAHGLTLKNVFGCYKDELEGRRATAFYSISSKNYAIEYVDKDGNAGSILHVRGFSLKSRYAQKTLNSARLKAFALALLEGEARSINVPQFSIRTDKFRVLRTHYFIKRYGNQISSKRYIIPNSSRKQTQSLPFGFSRGMLERALQ